MVWRVYLRRAAERIIITDAVIGRKDQPTDLMQVRVEILEAPYGVETARAHALGSFC